MNRRAFILGGLGLIGTAVGGGVCFVNQPKFGRLPSGDRLARIQASPHYIDGRFQCLEPVRSAANAFVQQITNLAACKLFACRRYRCGALWCATARLRSNSYIVVFAGISGVITIECTEELTSCARGNAAKRKTVFNSGYATVVVTDNATTLAICSSVVERAVKQAVGDVNGGCTVVVDIANDTAIVACQPSCLQCSGVSAILDDGLIDSSQNTAEDAALSATAIGVGNVHKAVDVADGGIAVASVCCNAASILEGRTDGSVDREVLDESTCGNDAEKSVVIMC